jgi:hypothetical protein
MLIKLSFSDDVKIEALIIHARLMHLQKFYNKYEILININTLSSTANLNAIAFYFKFEHMHSINKTKRIKKIDKSYKFIAFSVAVSSPSILYTLPCITYSN